MACANASTHDKKEKATESETLKEDELKPKEEPSPTEDLDKQEDKVSPPSQQNQQATASTSGRSINVIPDAYSTFDRIQEMYVRASNTPSFDSLCARVLDCPDEEDLLPPVVDVTMEQLMCPGWYRSLCASPDCEGDL